MIDRPIEFGFTQKHRPGKRRMRIDYWVRGGITIRGFNAKSQSPKPGRFKPKMRDQFLMFRGWRIKPIIPHLKPPIPWP